eukprot:gene3611-4122_t
MADKYKELGLIGRGAYGTVFKARDNVSGRMVALKRIKIVSTEEGMPVSTMREISLLKSLDSSAHPNIVRLYDVFQTASAAIPRHEYILTLVFEHVDQDLSQFLNRYPPPGVPQHIIKDMTQQLLSAVDFLHLNRMVHRDLKPQNILVTNNMRIKVADFGLARIYSFCMVLTSVVVTLWYRAPEVLLQSTYATAVDMWSVGCIFAEMYNKRPLFPGRSDADQLNRILAVIGAPLESEWPENVSLPWSTFEQYTNVDFSMWKYLVPDMCAEGRALLKCFLDFNPNKRISAREALEHSYFNGNDSPASQDSGIAMSQEDVASYDNAEELSSSSQTCDSKQDEPSTSDKQDTTATTPVINTTNNNMKSNDDNNSNEDKDGKEEDGSRKGNTSVKRKRDELDADVDTDQEYRCLSR